MEAHTEKLVDELFLEHFGVKGMKWGVRKNRDKGPEPIRGPIQKPIVRKTKTGEKFTMTPQPPGRADKVLSRISKSMADRVNNGSNLKIHDKQGKKIGEASFWFKGKDDIYLNWVTIEKSRRGQGYASEILKAAEQHGKKTGRKRMVLEVPGNAPDARHIYTKLGFVPTGVTQGHKGDIWGGLTEMEYKFGQKRR